MIRLIFIEETRSFIIQSETPASKTSCFQKTQQITQCFLHNVGHFFKIFQTSAISTLNYTYHMLPEGLLGDSWKETSSLKMLACFPLLLPYLIFAVISHFFATLCDSNKEKKKWDLLLQFTKGNLALSQFKDCEGKIDVSQVPLDIQPSNLKKLFQEINFSNPLQPFYIDFVIKDADNIAYSPLMLERLLDQLIQKIEGEVPYIGTPPEGTQELKEFYQTIRNAVRFIIFTLQSKKEEISRQYGQHSQNYREIQFLQSEIIIDLAVVGGFCGGRLMGEVIRFYHLMQENNFKEEQSFLKKHLFSLLARFRSRLVEQHISDQESFQHNVHFYNAYLENLGELLGIPGHQGIQDPLFYNFDKGHYLREFFHFYYTEEAIIEVVQAELKKEAFRDLILDWIKELTPSHWKKEFYQEKLCATEKIVNKIHKQVILSPFFGSFLKINSFLQRQKFPKPSYKNWEEWIDQLFQAAKDGELLLFPKQIGHSRRETKYTWKSLKEDLGESFIQRWRQMLKKNQLRFSVRKKFLEMGKIERLQQLIAFPKNIAKRIVQNPEQTKTVLSNYYERERKIEFMEFLLKDQNLLIGGLPPSLMRIFLITQKVLV
jgi:hypothetical protein